MTQMEEIQIAMDLLKARMREMEDEVRNALLSKPYPSAARRKQCKFSLLQVARVISDEFGVSVEDIRGPAQSRYVTMARNAFYLLAQEFTGHSQVSVGKFCYRHSSTVMSGKQRATVQRVVNRKFGALVKACSERMAG